MSQIIDKIILEWSYKTKKGYPDINNQEDLRLFEEIFGVNLMEILDKQYRTLQFSELKKRGGPRLAIFHDKIQSGEPFYKTNGEEVQLQFSSEEYAELFKNRDIAGIKKIAGAGVNTFPFFIDDNGDPIKLNDLLKTPEFGGKGAGSGTKVEDENLYLLKKKLTGLIGSEGGTIDVEVGGKSYKISGAETQPGMPKADFSLLDETGTPVVFISHKKAGGAGPSANDFIRWSGYTEYKDHPKVKTFITALNTFLEENNLDGLPNATRFVAEVEDKDLIRKLIYGPDYGGPYGKNNVNIIIQGEVILDNIGENKYRLTGEHVLLPPETPTGDYQPYFVSQYRGDRQMFGVKNNESIVMTKAVAFRSSNIYELQNGRFKKIK